MVGQATPPASGRPLAWAVGALALAALAVALAPGASAWSALDTHYEARDLMDGGPNPVYSLYDALGGWTCPALLDTNDGTSTNVVAGLTPPYVLRFYGDPVDSVYVDTNGYVGLHVGTAKDTSRFTPASIPTPALTPNGFVAVNWEDLHGSFGGGDICYQVFGTAPERVVAAIYRDVEYESGAGVPLQGLVLLYEGSDLVEAHVKTESDTDFISESLGIESVEGSRGMQYEYGESVRDTAIQYRPLSTYPTAVEDAYSYDFNETQVLRVAGGAGGLPRPLENDRPLGNVRPWATYTGGLPPSANIYPLALGVCDFTQPGQFAIDSSFCFTTTDTNPCVSGPYRFTYRTDDAYLDDPSAPFVDQATITVTATNCNRPPKANDDDFDVYEDFTLDVPAPGVMANDADLDLDTFEVDAPGTFLGSQGGTLVLAADGSLQYTPALDYIGDEEFTYRLRDGRGLRSVGGATIVFHVHKDMPPIAEFGYPLRVPAGVVFRLADLSYDAEGPIRSWAWDFGTPSPPGLTPPEHMYLYPGRYTVSLTVTDVAGVSSTARHIILVEPTPAASPSRTNPSASQEGHKDYLSEANATANATARPPPARAPPPPFLVEALEMPQADEGSPFQLVARTYNGVAPITFEWTQEPGLGAVLVGTRSATASGTAPDVPRGGTVLGFQVTATDSAGATATTRVDLMVRDLPRPPALTLTGPATVDAGQPIVLRANASDPDGQPVTLHWRLLSGDGELEADGDQATLPGVPGLHVVEVVAWDGELATRRTVTVVVEDPAPPTPATLPTPRSTPARSADGLPIAVAASGIGLAALAGLLLLAVLRRRRRPDGVK